MKVSINEIAKQIQDMGNSFISIAVVPVTVTLEAHDLSRQAYSSGTIQGELNCSLSLFATSSKRLSGVLIGDISVGANGAGATIRDASFKVQIALSPNTEGAYLVSIKGTDGVTWNQSSLVLGTQLPVRITDVNYDTPLLNGYPNPTTTTATLELGQTTRRFRGFKLPKLVNK